MTYDPAGATALIERIAESRRDFEREIRSRMRLLEKLEPLGPVDPLQAGIDASWDRLSRYHSERSMRYQRRFGKPPKREPPNIKPVYGEWHNLLEFETADGRQVPVSNINNALTVLRNDEKLSGVIATDLSTDMITLKGPLPFDYWDRGFVNWVDRPFLKSDATGVLEYLQSVGLSKLTQEDCGSAIKRIARENAWRPAVDEG